MLLRSRILVFFSFHAFALGLSAEPVISEFLAENRTGLKDEDGSEPDWIEIHNPATTSQNLAGWSLSDDPDHDQPWVFPAITLSPGARLVVFASGKNRRDTSGPFHTDFSLSAAGEYLALLRPDGSVAQSFNPVYPAQLPDISYGSGRQILRLVDRQSPISYYVPFEDIGTDWRDVGFADPLARFTSTSNSDPLFPGIGYDTGGDYAPLISTWLPNGTTTAFIRIPFDVTDASVLSGLLLEMQYDDAFVAWINGVEIARSTGAPSTPRWNSTSSQNHEAGLDDFDAYDLSNRLSIIRTGENVLAVQALNTSSRSSDLVVNPRLSASLAQGLFDYLTPPTPGAPNGEATRPGPEIVSASHTPLLPTDSDPITVTAWVNDRLAPIGTVELAYRVMYGPETRISMTPIGAGLYVAVIPETVSRAGDMVRWKVLASDTEGADSRLPIFLDNDGTNQSAEYFGTVVASPRSDENIATYHWFTQDTTNSRNRTGARASFFYQGKFYDNIFVRQRGGYTNGNSQKFDFNKGESFEYDPNLPKVGEINLNAEGFDSSYLRQPLAFGAIAEAGGPSSIAYPVQLLLNKNFDRVAIHVEQVDDDYVKRQNLPQGGALYKFVQRDNLRPALNDIETGVEKKTRLTEDFSDLEDLIDGLKQSQVGINIENSGSLIHTPTETQSRDRFLFDSLNVPAITNYLAAQILVQDTDDTRKNFYLYRDSEASGEWYLFPWDKDFTFGVGENAQDLAKHPFWGDASHKNPNANQWNILFDAVHKNPRIRSMILRRTRSLMDRLYSPSASNPNAWFESELRRLEPLVDSVLNISTSSLFSELDERRQDLYYNLYGPSSPEPLIPEAQSSSLALNFEDIDYNPASLDQDDEYIQLRNPNPEDLDISGWQLTGGVDFVFAPGTVVPGGQSIFVSPSQANFRSRELSPSGGEGHFVVGPYAGHLSNFGESLTLLDGQGSVIASTTYEGDPSNEQRFLVVSEFHYHPAENDDAEFIELLNVSDSVTLDLVGVKFSEGVDFAFADSAITTLGPKQRVLVVQDIAAFESIYGTAYSSRIAGVFANGSRLSNGGEQIKIDDATNSTIRQFSYLDIAQWPAAADGGGPSLRLLNPESVPDHGDPLNWVAGEIDGTPGTDDPTSFESWMASRATSDPLADPDGDGWSELQTFVLAGDIVPRDEPITLTRSSLASFIDFYRRDDPLAAYHLEISGDLTNWIMATSDVHFAIEVDEALGDGSRRMRMRLLPPHDSGQQIFLRIRSSLSGN
ncbi:MAG: lamin tail domain-containing protein [Luteolibacter sp.]